jgi:hypothetical protein
MRMFKSLNRNLPFLPILAVLVLGLNLPATAAQDPLDLGAADSVFAVVSQPRLGVDSVATVGIYFFNDAQAVQGASFGFSWNSDKFSLDSVRFSPQATAAFSLFRFGFYKGSADSSNTHRLFQCSGGGFSATALAAGAQPKLIATCFFGISNWAGGETFCVDSNAFLNASFVNSSGAEYSINWRGQACVSAGPDGDADGYGDPWDNCPLLANPGQEDADSDGIGDLCDPCTDTDLDGFGNPGYPATTCALDNCPFTYNPGQEDENGNGYGDACDSDCCTGRVGDANGTGGDEPTIGDVSSMIDFLFISQSPYAVACIPEADVNQSGGQFPERDDVTIGDISLLIDYLFITGSSLGLPNCL